MTILNVCPDFSYLGKIAGPKYQGEYARIIPCHVYESPSDMQGKSQEKKIYPHPQHIHIFRYIRSISTQVSQK